MHVINMMIEMTKSRKASIATTALHKQLQLICLVAQSTLWSVSVEIYSLTVPRRAAERYWNKATRRVGSMNSMNELRT